MGGEELKWRQLAHHQLMSPQGPHFSPHSTAKANDKSTNLRKIGNYGISDVAIASVTRPVMETIFLIYIYHDSRLTLRENLSEEDDYDNHYE